MAKSLLKVQEEWDIKLRIKSLKTQVLVWFGGVTSLILLLFNVAFYNFLEENIKLTIQNKLYNHATFINDNLLYGIPINEILKNKRLESLDVALINDNKIVYQKGNTNFKKLQKYIKVKDSFFIFNQGNNLGGLYILRISDPFKGAILFYEHKINKQIETKLQEVKNALFVLEPILLLLLIFVGSRLIDKILIPIAQITKRANKISVTDLSETIKQPLHDDEIKELVDSFNNMIKRLKNEVDTLERFNSDVSHELKTPLTVIKGEIEITLNKLREPEYYTKSLNTIEGEAETIQQIVDSLLMLTKYSKLNIEQTFQNISLDTIVMDTISHYNYQLKSKNIKIDIVKLESVEINANLQLINTIISNIIDNAIKYSLDNTTISISLYRDEKIYLIVEDEGIGIAKDDLENIMNRFYRVDESRNKKIKGFGLGLSIVKNSIELHNGTIEITSEINIGTKVKITL